MDLSITLVNLAGSIALLLWGVHMVQTGAALAARDHPCGRFQAL
jgi:phosphate:Na+ symporter